MPHTCLLFCTAVSTQFKFILTLLYILAWYQHHLFVRWQPAFQHVTLCRKDILLPSIPLSWGLGREMLANDIKRPCLRSLRSTLLTNEFSVLGRSNARTQIWNKRSILYPPFPAQCMSCIVLVQSLSLYIFPSLELSAVFSTAFGCCFS